MSLKLRIKEMVFEKMKEKDSEGLMFLRYFDAKIQEFLIDNREINEEDLDKKIISLLQKEKKKIEEEYGHTKKEYLLNQLKIVNTFLPEEMNEEELKALILEMLKDEKDISMKHMKSLMVEIPKRTKKVFDKSLVSKILKQIVEE